MSASDKHSSNDSEDSLQLPSVPQLPEREKSPPTVENKSRYNHVSRHRERSPSEEEREEGEVSLFIGLGPAGRSVHSDELRDFLVSHLDEEESKCVGEVRIRGRCAFADVSQRDVANRLISLLDGKLFKETMTLKIEVSKTNKKEAIRRKDRDNRDLERRLDRQGGLTLFIGLGPFARDLRDDDILRKLEEVTASLRSEPPERETQDEDGEATRSETLSKERLFYRLRRARECAFVDVKSAQVADHLLKHLNGDYIRECRLSVQIAKDRSPRRSRRSRSRSYSRSRSPHRSSRRRSSRGRYEEERRRHKRHRHRSYSESYSSSRSRSRSRSPRDRRARRRY